MTGNFQMNDNLNVVLPKYLSSSGGLRGGLRQYQWGTGYRDQILAYVKNVRDIYEWVDLLYKYQVVAFYKECALGWTYKNIGTSYVELFPASMRSRFDFTGYAKVRCAAGGLNSEAVSFYCKIQCSADQVTWSDLTEELDLGAATSDVYVIGAWVTIPSGVVGGKYLRAVGRAANDTADPTYKNVELHVN